MFEQVAIRACDYETGNGHRLAPSWFRRVLAVNFGMEKQRLQGCSVQAFMHILITCGFDDAPSLRPNSAGHPAVRTFSESNSLTLMDCPKKGERLW
jgi:hypothetical protein